MLVKEAWEGTLSNMGDWEYEFLQLFGNFAVRIKI